MSYSILYKRSSFTNNGNLIYDLSIDRCIANISEDRRKNDYFCSVLADPLKNEADIRFRREVLLDFIKIDGLLPSLKTLFNRYDKLKSDWIELKGTGEYSNEDKGSEAMIEYIYSSLKVTALFPKTVLSFYQTIVDTLSKYDIRSKGLCDLRDYAKAQLNNRSLAQTEEIASLFAYNSPSDYDFELVMLLGDTLSAEYAMISGIKKREKKKASLMSILTKKSKDDSVVENKSGLSREDVQAVLGEALYSIDRLLEKITDSIYSNLYGISAELDFYDVAQRYIAFLEEKGTDICYPEFSEGRTELRGVKDLFLLTETDSEVYANDFDLTGCSGALIKGKNNTGKTTFLRSISTAQLFFQAGLPVVAKSAVLPVYEGIYAHFSSAEEDFSIGDSSGRFEGEVKAVADIMDRIGDRSLVIFNETFQTTSYDEASDAMRYILSAISSLGGRYVFVTHLTDLFDMLDDNTAKFMSADGDTPFTIKKL